jgi:uncharacterized HAD superfamily protein
MIYIDLDDVACATADCLAAFARRHFDRDVTPADMFDYDLRKSFNFDEATYRRYMGDFHTTELLDIPDVPGACPTIAEWVERGFDPVIVTGRPTYTNAATREWLDARGLQAVPIIHVDKYAKLFNPSDDPLITPFPALLDMDVRFAIDDAPNAIRMIVETNLCPFALFTQPWNRHYTPPATDLPHSRVTDWNEIARIVDDLFSA